MKLIEIIESIFFGEINEANLSRLVSKVRSKDFAIVSGFRASNSLKVNRQINQKIKNELNSKGMGGYSLIGYWREAADGINYNDATEDQLTDIIEESLMFIKPDEMKREDFIEYASNLGVKYKQDAVIIGLIDGPISLYYKDGTNSTVGNKMTLEKIAQAYSRMRKKPNVPFVFEGVMHPTNNISRQIFKQLHINYLK